jgi:hypothetical protein
MTTVAAPSISPAIDTSVAVESDADSVSALAEVKETLRFFDVLAPDRFITFQGLPESREAKSTRLKNRSPRVVHGSLEQHVDALLGWSRAGCGVFFMVNEGDGSGRKSRNVKRVRAVFVDLDGSPLEPVLAWALAPHAVVESSPGRWHVYWRLAVCSVEEFGDLQARLAERFGGDPVVKDPPRLMRVPGFRHLKDQPFQARVERLGQNPPYRVADLRAALCMSSDSSPRSTEENRSRQRSTEAHGGHTAPIEPAAARQIEAVLREGQWRRYLPAEAGQRNRCVFHLAHWLCGVDVSLPASAWRPVVRAWHVAALPRIRTQDFAESWADFCNAYRKVKAPKDAYFDRAIKLAEQRALPTWIKQLGYGPRTEHLCKLVGSLHDIQTTELGSDLIFLSARQAAKVIGGDHTAAAKMLNCLVEDGVLRLFEKGAGDRASRYVYIGTR